MKYFLIFLIFISFVSSIKVRDQTCKGGTKRLENVIALMDII